MAVARPRGVQVLHGTRKPYIALGRPDGVAIAAPSSLKERALHGGALSAWQGRVVRQALLVLTLVAACATLRRARQRAARVSADRLVQRVRATIGHVASHPRSIRVSAAGGRVTLSGRVLAAEHADLVAAARNVRGVRAVHDALVVYVDAQGVPELQGGGSEPG